MNTLSKLTRSQFFSSLVYRARFYRAILASGFDVSETSRIDAIHKALKIPSGYSKNGMSFQRETRDLVSLRCGLNGEPRLLTSAAAEKLTELQISARTSGVTIGVKWAFRSYEDQARLIRARMLEGRTLESLLSWIAVPGYSEHHTGEAVDFETYPKDASFESTDAYYWLNKNAEKFDFFMSYPEGGNAGIIWEPWHWRYRSDHEVS